MECERCRAVARPGERFCTRCGAPLATVGDEPEPTQPVDAVGDEPEPTQPVDVVDPGSTDAADDATAPEPEARPVSVTAVGAADPSPLEPPPAGARPVPRLYDLALDEPDLLRDPPAAPDPNLTPPLGDRAGGRTAPTDQLPATGPAGDGHRHVEPWDTEPWDTEPWDTGHVLDRFRLGLVSWIGVAAGMAALFGMFTRVLSIRTTSRAPAFATGDWLVADFGTNLPAALIVTLVALLVGVVAAGFRLRWGAGLAGGAGLALAGWVALTVGAAERPIEVALDAVSRPSAEMFTVTITRDVGYWVLLTAGALGVVTFLASLASAGRDRRGLNPWIASLGAVAAVVAAAGPMLPEGTATIQDNWSPGSGGLGLPTWFVVGRLVQLGLLAYTGVVGFLLVRTYGLALALGGMSASVWLSLSTLLELTEAPVGPGFTNPGDTGAVDLHAVTIVGMTALVGLTVVAVIAAVEQLARADRR